MKFFLFSLLFIAVVTSCRQDELISDEPNNLDSDADIEVVKISSNDLKSSDNSNIDEYVLKFKNEDVLNKTIEKLEVLSPKEKLEWSNNFNNFNSLNSLYEQAMLEADSLDFTEDEYNAFKKKYGEYLYFPEYIDDYGAYLPSANKDYSSIANMNGKILVGNEFREIEKITTYEELQDYGLAYYSKEEEHSEIETRSSSKVTWNEIKTSAHTEEFSSGWNKVGNGKKIQVKFGIRNMMVRDKGICFHTEVSFRKKGFLGRWYNYSSETSIKVKVQSEYIPDSVAIDIDKILNTPNAYYGYDTQYYYYQASHSGSSSHDTYAKVPESFYLYQNKQSNIIKNYKLIINVDYRGMSNTISYTHTFKRSYCKMIENKTFWNSYVRPILYTGTVAIGKAIGEAIGEAITGRR